VQHDTPFAAGADNTRFARFRETRDTRFRETRDTRFDETRFARFHVDDPEN
jgi:hypothetical protein